MMKFNHFFSKSRYDDDCGVGVTHLRIVSGGAKVVAARLAGFIEFFALSCGSGGIGGGDDGAAGAGVGRPKNNSFSVASSPPLRQQQPRWGHARYISKGVLPSPPTNITSVNLVMGCQSRC